MSNNRTVRHKLRAKKYGRKHNFTAEEWKRLIEYYCPDKKCLCCQREKKLTVDHVVPLGEGGSNRIDNIQPLCADCNNNKGESSTDYRPDQGEYAQGLT